MSDERLQSHGHSTQTSRMSSYSGRHFDFMDTHHSVFSRNSYYNDMYSVHPWSRRPCSRFSGIPFTTLRAKSCSARLEDLSRPKIKRERLIRQEFFDNITNYAYSGVKSAALTARHSDRLVKLSQPKKPPSSYKDAYTLPKTVSEQALSAQATDRVRELAKPRRNIILLHTAWKNQQK
ncbi:unnamed protein product [Rotaria sp. Silwood1]|nr:unnamed protein product [Rotaria sp. Silwood1]CAF0968346.1 unnamed protein product [Rotaria sp. Silwood1]CAF0977612.1 unnamed protein product [Rotaria sp. Silwood1]CAF3382208.1 unnamed protein product [Rotaria sp. Silwood1]CAF3414299.1 unnamed protein product [Rotaria sp. Silwood1]